MGMSALKSEPLPRNHGFYNYTKINKGLHGQYFCSDISYHQFFGRIKKNIFENCSVPFLSSIEEIQYNITLKISFTIYIFKIRI